MTLHARSTYRALISAAVLGSALGTAYAAPQVTLRALANSAPDALRVPAFQRTEFSIALSGGTGAYANPFDPEEIAVDATAVGPGGQTLRLPAFWYSPYQRQQSGDGGIRLAPVTGATPEWRLRIALPTPGLWKITVAAQDRTGLGRSAPLSLRVTPSPLPGFVHRAVGEGRRRYFQRDNGDPYFLVGENLCWASRQRGLADYDDWFADLRRVGANYTRLWMEPKAIESKSSGLGRYDLQNAAWFDEVLNLADRNGIACMLAFGTYGEFVTGGYFNEGKWPINPYNAANGGPVPAETPKAFFTNAEARKLYRRRLRYLIARYSAYTSVAFWELWNETAAPVAWCSEMSGYLKTNDPYRHLVTNSYSVGGDDAVWSLPTIDLTQTHRYGDEGSIRDTAGYLPSDAHDGDRFEKPHLLGEFGISWRGSDDRFDPHGQGTDLHNALWSATLTGEAGGAAIWWWDSYVHPKNLYHIFAGLAKFSRHIAWPNRDFQPISVPGARSADTGTSTLQDLVLTPGASWGAKSNGIVNIGRDGQTSGNGALLADLFGPAKPENRSTLTLSVDLAKPTYLRLRIGTVSDRADLRIQLDQRDLTHFPLETRPDSGADFTATRQYPEYGGIYQAVYNKDRRVLLPAGQHTITLENTVGDWVGIQSYTLEQSVTAALTPVRPLALQDRRTGETLVWYQDPESNWANDREGKRPTLFHGLQVHVPVTFPGRYLAEWWDTRSGTIVRRATVTAQTGAVSLAVPAFERDIALRLARP